jgi:hypothetical protein
MAALILDFGNLPWSHTDAKEYAAKKGGTVSWDPNTRSWTVKRDKRKRVKDDLEAEVWT